MWFTRVSLKNPVFATMLMLALVVLGTFSYKRLKIDQFPNIDFPVVVVVTQYQGASPEIVESEVTKKLEEGINSIAGINTLSSRSYQNQSVIIVEFQLHINGRKAAEDVRERVANLRPLLRDEVGDPRVLRFDPASRAIWSLAVVSQNAKDFQDIANLNPKNSENSKTIASNQSGSKGNDEFDAKKDWSAVELTNWADQVLKKRLENVRGVGSVNLIGGSKREINLYLNPQALESFGISASQVVNAVRTESQNLPVGSVRSLQQDRVVQIEAEMERPEDFGQIIVARRGNAVIRVNQVAQVVDGEQEVENLALFNGQRTLLLSVQKSQDENTIEVVDALNHAVEELKASGQLPKGIALQPIFDQSRPIRIAVHNVEQTLLEGALLTILIVFLFLNSWRSTLITGLTLPIALIGTFFFMNLFGFTINMITLMALSLCVGLLIDDAIVVRENIVRHVQMGKSAYDASLDGTQEIGLAVLATTLSIVAVFLPIGFMEGIIGKFFHEFGITIVAAVLISMFVSFTLDPMLSSVWHDPSIHAHGENFKALTFYDKTFGRITNAFEKFTDDLSDSYQVILSWALRHKLLTLFIAIVIFACSIFMVRLLGTEFVPKADFSETTIDFYTSAGSSLENTESKARQVEQIVREFPEVRYTLTSINTGNAQGKMYASLYLRLVDRKDRAFSADHLSEILRDRLSRVPGITVTQIGLADSVGGGKPIAFSLQGPDLKELERLTRLILERLRKIPGLVDLDSSVKESNPVIAVDVRRDAAADLGLSINQIGSHLEILTTGKNVASWRAPDDQTYNVKVRLHPNARQTPQDLEKIPFVLNNASDGSTRIVRLNQIANLRESKGSNQINRRDMSREVSIDTNAHNRSIGEVSADIQKVMDEMNLPPGYHYVFGGSTKNMTESFGYAISALVLAIIFIYMILASQFKSFLQPLALMTSLPLTLIGVVLALLFFGSALSMFSIIGIVMLMGLVTKNAILLVDFAIRTREETAKNRQEKGVSSSGVLSFDFEMNAHKNAQNQLHEDPDLERTQALLLAAKVRLRPILMTTLAMIFGMLPLAFALSEGAEQRAPMGQAVIGGVITSSLLTLVVVPVMYCYMDDFSKWLKRLWNGTLD